ncbi:MAG: cytochrome c oxidase subunit II [Bacteroidales bacterium]|nr:cytochrome c oxidase subunit II [Bacteroidales bacterium]
MFTTYDPQYASNMVEGVDTAFMVIFGISFFFLIGITAVMIWFIIRYRRNKHPKAIQVKDNPALEITWTVIPTILVMIMFYYGYIAFSPMRDVPSDARVVKTVAKMWSWEFEYPGNKLSSELVLPINEPVVLEMVSLDVVHSLFISAFRVKEDVVPGVTSYMWFIPERLGNYEILCTEYCGLNHSFMESVARIVTREQFDTWLDSIPAATNLDEGLVIMRNNACTGCHSMDGTKLVGPSFQGIFGRTETVLIDGTPTQVTVDSAYLYRSITDPDYEVAEGYNRGLMKSYKGVIQDKDIQTIVQFLMTLQKE